MKAPVTRQRGSQCCSVDVTGRDCPREVTPKEELLLVDYFAQEV